MDKRPYGKNRCKNVDKIFINYLLSQPKVCINECDHGRGFQVASGKQEMDIVMLEAYETGRMRIGVIRGYKSQVIRDQN